MHDELLYHEYKEYKGNKKREEIIKELFDSGRYERITDTIWREESTGKIICLD